MHNNYLQEHLNNMHKIYNITHEYHPKVTSPRINQILVKNRKIRAKIAETKQFSVLKGQFFSPKRTTYFD